MVDSDFVIDTAWRVDALHQMRPTVGGRWANDPVLSQAKEVQCLLAIAADAASSLANTNQILAKVTTIEADQAALLSAVGTIKAGVAQILTILESNAPA